MPYNAHVPKDFPMYLPSLFHKDLFQLFSFFVNENGQNV